MDDFSKSASSMQQPADLITLLIYLTPMFSPIRVLIEAGVFRGLAASSQPVSVRELASNVPNAQQFNTEQDIAEREEFIVRMLRAVCGLNLVDEAGTDFYQANELTRTLAKPGFEAGFNFLHDTTMGPQSTNSHLLSWAKEHGYKAPTTSTDGPYQQARGITGTTCFEDWTRINPIHMSNLSALMKEVQKSRVNWHAWFPSDVLFPSEPGSSDAEEGVFMVDVGGGLAHDISAFASRYSDKKLRLVVEDQPEVISETREQELDSRIELVEHNFFQPQPVKGAKIYYMHKILHDWPDSDCIQILSHLRDAMSPDSRILINDVILPDQGTPLIMAAFDITMLVDLNAKERSESMWQRLISQIDGLSIRKFWQAPDLKGEGIVEIVRTP